jgi:hypothetical protein
MPSQQMILKKTGLPEPTILYFFGYGQILAPAPSLKHAIFSCFNFFRTLQ